MAMMVTINMIGHEYLHSTTAEVITYMQIFCVIIGKFKP